MLKFLKQVFPQRERSIIYCITAGLMVCQGIACFQIFLANSHLQAVAFSADKAGILYVPSYRLVTGALTLKTLFLSALFITASLGTGLSLLTLALLRASDSLSERFRLFKWAPFLVWFSVLIYAVTQKVSGFTFAYLFLIPLGVNIVSKKSVPEASSKGASRKAFLLFGILLIVLASSLSQVKRSGFVAFRDLVLYQSSPGEKLVNFYYQYAFYPANAIASLDQKPVKTCFFQKTENTTDSNWILPALQTYGFSLIDKRLLADLVIEEEEEHLLLFTKDTLIAKVPKRRFQQQPAKILQEFAGATDRNRTLRYLLYLSLILGFPAALLLFLYLALKATLTPLTGPSKATRISFWGLLLLVFLLFCPWFLFHFQKINPQNLDAKLTSGASWERLAALSYIDRKQLDITEVPSYQSLLQSKQTSDRIWLAKNLGHIAQSPKTRDLRQLLVDTNNNVVCQAMRSLAQRGEISAISEIKSIQKATQSWYLQDCAFKSLRQLQ